MLNFWKPVFLVPFPYCPNGEGFDIYNKSQTCLAIAEHTPMLNWPCVTVCPCREVNIIHPFILAGIFTLSVKSLLGGKDNLFDIVSLLKLTIKRLIEEKSAEILKTKEEYHEKQKLIFLLKIIEINPGKWKHLTEHLPDQRN